MSGPLVRRGGLLSPTRLVLIFLIIFLYYVSSSFKASTDYDYEAVSSLHTPTPTPGGKSSWDELDGPPTMPGEAVRPEQDWYAKVPSPLKNENKKKGPGKGKGTGKGTGKEKGKDKGNGGDRVATAATKTQGSRLTAPTVIRPWMEDVDDESDEHRLKGDKHSNQGDGVGEGDVEDDESLPIWAHSTSKSSTFRCPPTTPLADSILLVLKTGATELYSKLPMHLVTTLRCVPHYMIFSDLEQEIQSLHVEDALAEVSPKWKNDHHDFELYRKQQELLKEGMDIGTLKGGKGWDLDKWKFLPMIKKTWEKRPLGMRWFVFVETDTFLSWHNLLLWLAQLDADNRLYMGSQVMIGDTEFAHGGSGYIISHGAMRRLYEEVRDNMASWEEKMPSNCCGDKVLSEALLARDVRLMRSFPLTQGERVWSIDWSDTHWCKAAVTWHHLKPNEVDAHWRFETEWSRAKKDQPILYRDYYAHFVAPNLRDSRDGWDNFAGDWEVTSTKEAEGISKEAHTSFDACREACKEKDECILFKWSPGACGLGKVPRLGRPVEGDEENQDVKSGWLVDKIEKYVAKRDKCKPDDNWILR